MQLSPEEPLVLNYLGYTWIDQSRNLQQGLALIEKAVRQKPDDGYIVDSLGWAQFRMGRYKEAVKYLERAVELRPEDPVLNDHLGDGYWRVGREREARFQWEQALTLSPEPDDAEKIKRKLLKGLPSPAQARQVKRTKEAVKAAPAKKSTQAKQQSFPFFQ
jgi:tetratricopeptide (TPR) repeat protein